MARKATPKSRKRGHGAHAGLYKQHVLDVPVANYSPSPVRIPREGSNPFPPDHHRLEVDVLMMAGAAANGSRAKMTHQAAFIDVRYKLCIRPPRRFVW